MRFIDDGKAMQTYASYILLYSAKYNRTKTDICRIYRNINQQNCKKYTCVINTKLEFIKANDNTLLP